MGSDNTTAFCNWDTPETSTAKGHDTYNAPGQDCLFVRLDQLKMPEETPIVLSAERADEHAALYTLAPTLTSNRRQTSVSVLIVWKTSLRDS